MTKDGMHYVSHTMILASRPSVSYHDMLYAIVVHVEAIPWSCRSLNAIILKLLRTIRSLIYMASLIQFVLAEGGS